VELAEQVVPLAELVDSRPFLVAQEAAPVEQEVPLVELADLQTSSVDLVVARLAARQPVLVLVLPIHLRLALRRVRRARRVRLALPVSTAVLQQTTALLLQVVMLRLATEPLESELQATERLAMVPLVTETLVTEGLAMEPAQLKVNRVREPLPQLPPLPDNSLPVPLVALLFLLLE
jgi:hypothetical protein